MRSRSESPLVGAAEDLLRDAARCADLYSAVAARKKVEQDSLLLANRLRLLRAEEEKTRRKVSDTEKKTREILDLRRRNEERRLQKEAEESRREAEEQEQRLRQAREREEQHRKLQEKQRSIQDKNAESSAAVKQDREAARALLQERREADEAEVAARAEKVRVANMAASRSRARSEGAKQELAKHSVRERIIREEDERRQKLVDIERMEREEADLLSRLQRSQERHKMAYLRLEDAINSSGSALTNGDARSVGSRSGCGTPLRESRTPTGSRSLVDACESALRAPAGPAIGSRPPRPRGGPSAAAGASLAAGGTASRPQSARAGAPRRPSEVRGGSQKPVAPAASNCSTASGSGATSSGRSTPSTPEAAAAAAQPITYTTMDGQQLEIPAEEDLDLASLLNG